MAQAQRNEYQMIRHEHQLRVRYSETDQMGYVYYGNYAQYFEIGRTELIRAIGWPYRAMEEAGIMLPVHSMEINFKGPATYDDELTIVSMMKHPPKGPAITIFHEIYCGSRLITIGSVTLVFVRKNTMRPVAPPPEFTQTVQRLLAQADA